MRRLSIWLCLSLLSVMSGLAHAAPSAAEPAIPEALKPWREWVLHGEEPRLCPALPGAEPGQNCAWPGTLRLDLDPSGGAFAQDWTLYAKGWVSLPGGVDWPQEVTVNDASALVVPHQGVPSVYLPAGPARIAGRFVFERRPERLTLPNGSALLQLRLNGEAVARPDREGNQLWLGRPVNDKPQAEALQLTVFRRLKDAHPLELDTEIHLQVAGPGREIVLDQMSLADFVPMALEGELPARLEADGRLRVQLRPGSWTLSIHARALKHLETVQLPTGADGGREEIWSFAGHETLRVSSLEGAPPVDAGEAGVPEAWRALPAFRVAAGQRLTLVERSRGQAVADANRLSLSRQMWLAFDGDSYTLKDTVQGQVHKDWRLDMAAPYRLRQASANGQELLVTEGGSGLTGVELREPALNLTALATVARADARLASGWREAFDGVSTTLYLPPGYRLIAAQGADEAGGAWLARWTLMDFFLVLVIAVAAWKLLGWQIGVLVLLFLSLTMHEGGAPQWLWLNLIAALALLRYLPENRFARWVRGYRNLGFALLVMVAVPFVALQLRVALHPQLEDDGLRGGMFSFEQSMYSAPPVDAAADAEYLAQEELAAVQPSAAPPPSGAMLEKSKAARPLTSSMESRVAPPEISRYDADAKIQTGPGVPSWEMNAYPLAWAGPVTADQELSLTILPAWGTSLLRVVAVALLMGLLALLAKAAYPSLRLPRLTPKPGLAAPALVLVLLGTLLPVATLRAELPTPEMLEQLKQRLLAPPPCGQQCVSVSQAQLNLADDNLTIELDASAQAGSALAIPGSAQGWSPSRATVDGQEVPVLRHGDTLYLALTPARHRIVLTGAMPPADSVQLSFSEPPRRVSVNVQGWEVAGLNEGRLQAAHLEFTRIKRAAPGETRPEQWAEMTQIPAFAHVQRELRFDREWSVRTTVLRRAPARGPLAIAVPLLDGESVQSADMRVEDGKVLVVLPAGQDELQYLSFLARKPTLTLKAADSRDSVEIWSYVASPSLHVEHSGVPSLAQSPEQPSYQPTFYPRAGETLTLSVSRPSASAGETLAIDRATLAVSAGARARENNLTLSYRSSRGGQHSIALPPDAEVGEVLADGRRLGLRPEGGKLLLPIQPGSHQLSIAWRQNEAMALRTTLPAVDLQHPASNLELTLSVPEDRWVLLAGGPRMGPAVLYWGELAVFILIALALGRLKGPPLRSQHWLLLGLGLSTLAWGTFALVAVWLFLLARRARMAELPSRRWFNGMQLALALLTLIALGTLVSTIPQALLASPEMHVTGNGSSASHLRWFADATAGVMPEAWVVSLPLWVYRVAMLAWALWLSFALVGWLRWGWGAFASGGLWRAAPPKPEAAAPETSASEGE